MDKQNFVIGGQLIEPGQTKTVYLNLARLFDYTELKMPLRVIRGTDSGPTMFISGGIHGDEVVGPEIIRRLLQDSKMKKLKGTLIAVPIVNVFGYNRMSRYLPDRRDLNRSFPGSKTGSLASRVADIFVEEILTKCSIGIDLHSGSNHRANLPQIRANLEDAQTLELAQAFGAPVILHSHIKDGSLRETASDMGIKSLLFEGGESLRIDERVIRSALQGIGQVMQDVGMLVKDKKKNFSKSYIAKSSYWSRAPQSGAIRTLKKMGTLVQEGETLAVICDSFGEGKVKVKAKYPGIIIGMNNLAVVNGGDALFHIATFTNPVDSDAMPEDFYDYFD